MKKIITVFLILICISKLNAQEMAYKFGYIFKSSLLSKDRKLFLIKKIPKNVKDTIGIFFNPSGANQTYITKDYSIKVDTFPTKLIAFKLKGSIVARNEDSIFIKFWDITNDPSIYQDNDSFVNSANNGKDFVYKIDSAGWKESSFFRGKFFDFPFRFTQFMATSLPFRVLTKSGNLESDFLNANIAYLAVAGHTRIFKSEFVKPRNRYFAFGPYLGLSSINNPVTTKKEFGLNYGLSIVCALQGFNITVAYGFQNGFQKETKEVQPYMGFGIGFKLLETFAPEIKSKGD